MPRIFSARWINSLFLEDDNFDPQAENISVKPEICMRQMTHETILSCVRLRNNASMARKTQPWQNTECRHIEHMHEGVWFTKNNFDKMTAVRTIFP